MTTWSGGQWQCICCKPPRALYMEMVRKVAIFRHEDDNTLAYYDKWNNGGTNESRWNRKRSRAQKR